MPDIITAINNYLSERKIKQKMLAEGIEMSEQLLNMILKGKRTMRLTTYWRICKFLNVGVEYFFERAGEKQKNC